jgi:hypothetical protein
MAWQSGSRCRPWVQAPVLQKRKKKKKAKTARKVVEKITLLDGSLAQVVEHCLARPRPRAQTPITKKKKKKGQGEKTTWLFFSFLDYLNTYPHPIHLTTENVVLTAPSEDSTFSIQQCSLATYASVTEVIAYSSLAPLYHIHTSGLQRNTSQPSWHVTSFQKRNT